MALVFAWAFELTPEGLQREVSSEIDKQGSVSSRKKFGILIFAGMALALVYFGLTHNWQTELETIAPGEIRSIVVLLLDNLMNDPEQGYFVEGMHEALITELSKIKALRFGW